MYLSLTLIKIKENWHFGFFHNGTCASSRNPGATLLDFLPQIITAHHNFPGAVPLSSSPRCCLLSPVSRARGSGSDWPLACKQAKAELLQQPLPQMHRLTWISLLYSVTNFHATNRNLATFEVFSTAEYREVSSKSCYEGQRGTYRAVSPHHLGQ